MTINGRYLRTCLQARATELYRRLFPKLALRPIERRESLPDGRRASEPSGDPRAATAHSALRIPHSRPAPLFQPFLSAKSSPRFRRVSNLFVLPLLCLLSLAPSRARASGVTLVTIAANGTITPGTMPGLIVDPRAGNKVDIYFPYQLNPGDTIKWTAGANTYTQTIGFGTATQVYYNSGGHFDITLPASQDPSIAFTSTPMTSQVTLTLGDSTQVTTAFGVPYTTDPYLCEGSEHWQWHDVDPDSD